VSRFKGLKKWLTLENNSGNENPQDKRGRGSALTLEEQVKSGLGILARTSNLFSYGDKLGSIRINDLPNCN
jgi:hypothetical protein